MNGKLGPETGQHNPDCNAETGPEQLCGAPAVAHLLIDDEDNNILACEAHLAAAHRVFDVQDEHPAQVVCVMPGALWSVPKRCCFVEGLEWDLSAESVESPELVSS